MPGTVAVAKRALLGRRRASRDPRQLLLPRWMALAVFSATPLSTVAYAVGELMLVLALAGAAAPRLTAPLSAGVALLVLLVVGHLRQVVRAYPGGGGVYRAVRASLGGQAALVVGAALLAGHAVTVAVSVTAAAAALGSAAPALADARAVIAVGLLVLVAAVHLRGVGDAGGLVVLPTLGFVAALTVLLAVGAVRCGLGVGGCPSAAGAGATPPEQEALTTLLVARALAVGAAALTGLAAVGHSVPAFRYPQAREARWVLTATGAATAAAIVGVGLLATATGVVAAPDAERTVLAEVTAALLGEGLLFAALQLATAAVLLLAAMTVLADLPRLASVLARDRVLPRQYAAHGDRIVFSNATLVVATAAAVLVLATGGRLSLLVPLLVVLVATALSGSQIAMARHRWLTRGRAWRTRLAVNAVGAVGTGVVGVVLLITELAAGVWAAVVAVAALAVGLRLVRRHHDRTDLRLRADVDRPQPSTHDALIVVDRIDEAAARALSWVLASRPRSIAALGIPIIGADLERRWSMLSGELPLTVVARASERHATDRAVAAVAAHRRPDRPLTVVLAEELARSWGDQLRRHRLDLRLKDELRLLDGVAVVDVTSPVGGPGPYTVEEPAEHHVLLLVSRLHAGVERALAYARLLRPTTLRALSVNIDPDASARLLRRWDDAHLSVPLELVDSPFRSLADGVRDSVRRFAPDGRQSVVSCVLPELVGLPPWAAPLHGQSALAIRSALLFERGVVTITVSHRLEAAPSPDARARRTA